MKIIAVSLAVVALLNLVFIQSLDAQGLTQLYNSKVVSAQRYERPLDFKAPGWIKSRLPKHCGVIVTLEGGQRWLVHKGNEFGQASETVVVSPSFMSSAWSAGEYKTVRSSTVADYVSAGGARYSLLFNNCLHACNRMMRLS